MSFSFKDRFMKHWFITGLIVKLLFFCIFFFSAAETKHRVFIGISLKGADYNEQFETVDNLVDHGTLSLTPGGEPYAGRTPGYIFPYIAIRYFFSKEVSWQIEVILQVIFNIIAAWIIFKILWKYSGRFNLCFAFFVIYLAGTYSSWLEFELAPDNLALSAFIVGTYYFFQFFETKKISQLILAGALIGWMFHLRGYLMPFALSYSTVLFYNLIIKEKQFKRFVFSGLVFFFPFIIITSLWTIRNYTQFKKIIPFQNAYVPGVNFTENVSFTDPAKYSLCQVRKLFSAWGGDNLWYFPGAEMHWLMTLSDEEAKNYKFKESIFCEEFNRDSLEHLREVVHASHDLSLNIDQHIYYETKIIEMADRFRMAYKAENPLGYALSPITKMKNFFNKNPTFDWAVRKKSFGYYYRIIPVITYYLAVILAIAALLYFIYNRKQADSLIVFLFGNIFLFMISFSMITDLIHPRYFEFAYVCCFIVSGIFIGKILNRQNSA